ncbi:G3E family GTPase [Isoptericola jiangsuensis]|uniref:G3E family GTPase n=1 Tax=Isoptericola jiangsuensis TaxID=548579 RepID=A0A2A9EXA3_9MICO|nr:GTP-binding protein [Isoptericola jiangsuensis]PFG43343.1 G3E family GTPase [Isoptericola jiangsuensis]
MSAFPHDEPVALSVLVAVDPVLQEAAATGLALDAPRTVTVRHDLTGDDGVLRRVVLDAGGVLEDEQVPLEHTCLSCCVREDAVPTLRRLAADGRWDDIVLALPTTAEPLPVVRALGAETSPGGALIGCRLATTFAVVDLDTLEDDLLGATLCGERGLALAADDERSVGEALAAQLEQVDLVVTTGDAATGSGLVDRLRGRGTRRLEPLHALRAADLAAGRHDAVAAERRAHPLAARTAAAPGTPARPDDRSWTLVLTAARPLHPERLLARVEDLGTGPLRARGVFRVANRPDSACLWDGAGGQTFLADLGPWEHAAAGAAPTTRLCVVGAGDPSDADLLRRRIVAAFDAVVATPDEVADGGLAWLGAPDVLAPWLGDRSPA